MKTRDSTRTTTGSTFSPGDSSVYSPISKKQAIVSQRTLHRTTLCAPIHSAKHFAQGREFGEKGFCPSKNILSIVLLLPPAPAARVLFGRAFAIFSFWSAAARRRITARAPPGGGGESGREEPVAAPVEAPAGGELTGDDGRGEDC